MTSLSIYILCIAIAGLAAAAIDAALGLEARLRGPKPRSLPGIESAAMSGVRS